MDIQVGDKVQVTVYGEVQTGVVTWCGAAIAGVRMDKSGRVRWFHRESLSKV